MKGRLWIACVVVAVLAGGCATMPPPGADVATISIRMAGGHIRNFEGVDGMIFVWPQDTIRVLPGRHKFRINLGHNVRNFTEWDADVPRPGNYRVAVTEDLDGAKLELINVE